MAAIIVPTVEHIIGPSAQNGARQRDNQQIDHRIPVGFKALGSTHGVQPPQHESGGENHAIPADGPAKQTESHWIDLQRPVKQLGERNKMNHRIPSLPFKMCGRRSAPRFKHTTDPPSNASRPTFFADAQILTAPRRPSALFAPFAAFHLIFPLTARAFRDMILPVVKATGFTRCGG